MKKIMQTLAHNPPHSVGNCFQACVASVLEMDLEAVPHFVATDENTYDSN